MNVIMRLHVSNILLICILLMGAPSSFSQVPTTTPSKEEIIVVTTTGIGKTFEEALSQALLLAVGEVNGIEIQREVNVEKIVSEYKASANASLAGEAYAVNINANEIYNTNSDTTQRNINGVIKTFRVLSGEDKSDTFLSSLFTPGKEAWVLKVESSMVLIRPAEYKATLASKRLKIAVVPPRIGQEVSSPFASTLPMFWSQELVSRLSKSGRVAVIDREYSPEINLELQRISGQDFNRDEMSKLGNLLGADYLIVSSLDKASVSRDVRKLELADRTIEGPQKANFTLSYRVIELATGIVEFADRISMENREKVSLEKLAQDSVVVISNSLNEILFPLRVELIDSGLVYLGGGESNVKIGDSYVLIKRDQTITDSYTGEVIGHQEREVGTIVIKEVLPKISKGEFVVATTYVFSKSDEIIARRVVKESAQVSKDRITTNTESPVNEKDDVSPVSNLRESVEGEY